MERTEIKTEELVELKEKGMKNKEIVEYFETKGIYINDSFVYQRLKRYYEKQGKPKPQKIERRRRTRVDPKELARKREEGLSYHQMEVYFARKGLKISSTSIKKALSEYYGSNGMEVQECKKNVYVNLEEIYKLRDDGLSYEKKAKQLTDGGTKISVTSVKEGLDEYNRVNSKSGTTETNCGIKVNEEEELKYILLKGLSIEEFVDLISDKEREAKIREKFKKLSVVVMHSKKENDKWIPDYNFIELILLVENPMNDLEQYISNVKNYLVNGVCEKGKIDFLKDDIFNGNTDLMVYVLSRMETKFLYGYDTRVYVKLMKTYEQKIDQYISRLHSIEDNRRKSKINSEIGDKEGTPGEER